MQTLDTGHVNKHYELKQIHYNSQIPALRYQIFQTRVLSSKDIARTTIIQSEIYTTVIQMRLQIQGAD